MKELIFEQTGHPLEVLQLREIDVPTPKPHEVLIKVKARNINPSDIMFVRGMYGITPKLPSSAGFEASGVVEQGDESGKIKAGTRVMFTAIGTWREYVCVPAALVIPVPPQMPDEVACQAFVNPMTAYGMIEESGLQAGEWLLITAGASAFGKFAIQMAKAAGATVIATAGSDEKCALALANGAEFAINYRAGDFAAKVKELTGGKGVKVVYDSVGKDTFDKSLDCLRPFGLMASFGNASGPVAPFAPGSLGAKGSLYVTRQTLFTHIATRESTQAMADDLFAVVASGQVKIHIDQRYPLADVQQAHRDLEARKTTGCTILTL